MCWCGLYILPSPVARTLVSDTSVCRAEANNVFTNTSGWFELTKQDFGFLMRPSGSSRSLRPSSEPTRLFASS